MSAVRNLVRYSKRAFAVVRGQDVWQGAQIRCERLYLGDERACWCICPDELSSESIVYSFGIGENISFDLELISHFGVNVHSFDPTPRSLEWLDRQKLPERFIVHRYGLANYEGACMLFPPENPLYVSHSAIQRRSSASPIEVPVHKIGTIMQLLGHDRINLLKMDIEGAEYDVLADLLATGIRVDQLLVEFHHRWPSVGLDRTREAIRQLNRAGHHIFNVSPNGEEYSFKRVSSAKTSAALA